MAWTWLDPDMWAATLWREREAGGELLLLAPVPGGMAAWVDRGGTLRAWARPWKGEAVPRLSARGFGEARALEADLARDHDVAWEGGAPDKPITGTGVFVYPLGPVHGDVSESLLYRLAVLGTRSWAWMWWRDSSTATWRNGCGAGIRPGRLAWRA